MKGHVRNWLAAVFCGAAIWAGGQTAENPDERAWELGASFGYGMRSNPLVAADDVPLYVDVNVAWFGKRWFFDNGDLGFTLHNGDRATVNAVARVNSERLFFSRVGSRYIGIVEREQEMAGEPVEDDEPIEIPSRRYAFEGGVEALIEGGGTLLYLSAFHDLSGTHRGFELHADLSVPVYRGRWLFEPAVGATWKSGRLNDYYWGMKDDEANVAFPAYEAGAGTNIHLRLAASYRISEHWQWSAVIEWEALSAAVRDSPLVEDSAQHGFHTGLGFAF